MMGDFDEEFGAENLDEFESFDDPLVPQAAFRATRLSPDPPGLARLKD